jgi:tetratricopeptide (TPR) repeat protein
MRKLSAPLLLLALGCSDPSAPPIDPTPVDPTPVDPTPIEPVRIDTARTSTDGELALRNLDSQIDARLASVARRPEIFEVRRDAVGLLLSRSHYLGAYDDFVRAGELADEALAMRPNDPIALSMAADVASAVHRFSDVATHLDAAARLGDDVALDRVTLYVSRGERLDEALALAEEAVRANPSYGTHVARASALAALERYEEADEAFLDALETYRDVSPFPLAWVAFQRGVMWAEMADRPELARALYEEAVRRVPPYVVANVHLAELEVAAGETDRAIARLEALLPRTADAEPHGVLGELLATRDPETARAHVEESRARYERLLDRHFEAFLDHGSEFFASVGQDPARALQLAETNLENRRNARAYIVALEAARAAEDATKLCSIRADAIDAESQSAVLRRLVGELATECD